MLIADISNPFRDFMLHCGMNVDHTPRRSKDSIFGMGNFFNWAKPGTQEKMLYVICLDGFSSETILNTWSLNKHIPFIPDFITQNKNAVVLFENGAEGHCVEMFEFVHQVTQHYNLSNVFYANSCVNVSDVFKKSAYESFDVIYAQNYKEDIMLEMDVEQTYNFNTSKRYLFNCLNNAPKAHRALLLGALIDNNLTDNLISSPLIGFDELTSTTMQYVSKNYDDVVCVKKALCYLKNLKPLYPMHIDTRNDDIVHMKSIGDSNFYEKLLDCDIQLVTESTVGDELYFTEKVFKPIILNQPFVLFGPRGLYSHFRSLGYKTYDHLIDEVELYDDELNLFTKINMLINTLNTLSSKKHTSLWDDIVLQNRKCAKHNYETFLNRCNMIKKKTKVSLETWLEVYPDFQKIF